MPTPHRDSPETRRLLARVQTGSAGAVGQLLARHQDYLRRFVDLHLDPRLRRRIDPSDVVQETQLEAVRRIPTYAADPPMPFRLWLRQIAFDRLLMLQRRHAGAQRRSLTREVALPEGSTIALARQVGPPRPSPSQILVSGELARRVNAAIALLPHDDREILLMRNFEGLSNGEAAAVLGIAPEAASKRYGRALLRLRTRLIETGLEASENGSRTKQA